MQCLNAKKWLSWVSLAGRLTMYCTKLSIVIVTWNSAQRISKCLEAILHDPSLPSSTEVIVSDNASSDDTVAIVDKRFPSVSLIRNLENLGFGAANNEGFAESHGEYVLFLNDDAMVTPGAVSTMMDFAERHPAVGLIGPRLLNPDGSLQRSITNDSSVWLDMLWVLMPFQMDNRDSLLRRIAAATARHLHLASLGHCSDHSRTSPVSCVKGASMLVRRSVLEEVGGFDEDIFLWAEENELCRRIRKAGWRIVYYPEAEVIHVGGSSVGRFSAINPTRLFVQKHKSNLHIFETHSCALNLAVYKLGMVAILLLRSLVLSLRLSLCPPQSRLPLLQRREAFIATVRVLIDPAFRSKNIYTEVDFSYLD